MHVRASLEQPEEVVCALKPPPDEGAREDGKGEVVVDAEVEGLDDGTTHTHDEGSGDAAKHARVEDKPVVVHGRSAVPEADADEEARNGRGKEAGERLARGKGQELDAGEVGREWGSVTTPQTAESGSGRVRPREAVLSAMAAQWMGQIV